MSRDSSNIKTNDIETVELAVAEIIKLRSEKAELQAEIAALKAEIQELKTDSKKYDFDKVLAEAEEIIRLHPIRKAELEKKAVELTSELEAQSERVKMLNSEAKAIVDQFDTPQDERLVSISQSQRTYLEVVRDCVYNVFCEERDRLINGLTCENLETTVAQLVALREKNPIRTIADLKEGNGNRSIVSSVLEVLYSATFHNYDYDRIRLYRDLLGGLTQHKVFRTEIIDRYRLKAELDPENSQRYKHFIAEDMEVDKEYEEKKKIAEREKAVLAEYKKLETEDLRTRVSSFQFKTKSARFSFEKNEIVIKKLENKIRLLQSGRFFEPSLRTRYYAEAAEACANVARENKTAKQGRK